jgi:phosphohistidine phosphatase
MARLYLLRHAKSDWGHHGLSDHERPLNDRGRSAAAKMGLYAARAGIRPDIVLCSTAVRAKQTLSHLMEAGGLDWAVQYEPALYGAGVDTILRTVAHDAAACESAMVVGHNPGFHDTALALAARGSDVDMRQLYRKYPTGTLSAIDFSFPRLGDIVGAQGTLALFRRPKDLG